MKRLIALVVLLVLGATLFVGCTDPDKGKTEIEKDVVITESYTFKNPENLEFDDRRVYKAGEAMLTGLASMGIQDAYMIIFGKGTTPVYQCEIYVFADNATAVSTNNTMFGGMQQVEGDCLLSGKDETAILVTLTALNKSTFEDMIEMNESMGYILVTDSEEK